MKECKYVTRTVHLFSHLSSSMPMMAMILKAYMKTVQFLGFLVYTSQLGSVWQNPKWMGLTLETNEKYPLASPQYCIMTHWLWLYVCSLQWKPWRASRCCTTFPCTVTTGCSFASLWLYFYYGVEWNTSQCTHQVCKNSKFCQKLFFVL